jgi:hypothetical protein
MVILQESSAQPTTTKKMAGAIWLWLSFIQTQALAYINAIDRKWIRIVGKKAVVEESEFYEVVGDSANRSFISNHTEKLITSINNIDWEHVKDEANQVGMLIRTYSEWAIIKFGGSVKTMIEAQLVTEPVPNETPKFVKK